MRPSQAEGGRRRARGLSLVRVYVRLGNSNTRHASRTHTTPGTQACACRVPCGMHDPAGFRSCTRCTSAVYVAGAQHCWMWPHGASSAPPPGVTSFNTPPPYLRCACALLQCKGQQLTVIMQRCVAVCLSKRTRWQVASPVRQALMRMCATLTKQSWSVDLSTDLKTCAQQRSREGRAVACGSECMYILQR